VTKRRAIFLDRDGVINANRPDHVKAWDEFTFLPHVLDALRQIAASDFLVIITTNQAAIARKMVDEGTVRDIHARMTLAIERAGGRVDAIYYCPHLPEENCNCRKPQPGMYLRAAQEFDLDLARSYVVGDALADVAAAQAIGAQPVLVLTGRGREQQARLIENNHVGYQVVEDLASAVEWIWQREKATL
jgi:D-glycero-D-manno-heptose 1,7-bisphosphate phosphatase